MLITLKTCPFDQQPCTIKITEAHKAGGDYKEKLKVAEVASSSVCNVIKKQQSTGMVEVDSEEWNSISKKAACKVCKKEAQNSLLIVKERLQVD